VLPEEQELDLLSQKSEEQIQMAKQANQNGDNYILLTVLFATVLFFSGVGTKYKTFLIKVFMLGGGAIIFLTAVTFLIIYPVY
jgi:hypothetical protein